MLPRPVLAALVVCLTACGGSKQDPWEEALAKAEEFQKRVCACENAACADQVMKEREAFLQAWATRLPEGSSMDEKLRPRFNAAESAIHGCADRLTASTPVTR